MSVLYDDKNKNGFSLLFKEGRKVTKYELLAKSEEQRDFLVKNLLSLKEAEQQNTTTILSSMGGGLSAQ